MMWSYYGSGWLGFGLLNLLSRKRKKRTVGSHSVLVVKFFVLSFTILSFYSFCRSRKVHNLERELAVMAVAASFCKSRKVHDIECMLVEIYENDRAIGKQADIASVMRKWWANSTKESSMKNIESIDHLIIQNEVNLDFHAIFGISLNTFLFFWIIYLSLIPWMLWILL